MGCTCWCARVAESLKITETFPLAMFFNLSLGPNRKESAGMQDRAEQFKRNMDN